MAQHQMIPAPNRERMPHSDYGESDCCQNNLLIRSATPLLTLVTHIKHTSDHHNVPKLRLQIIEEIKNFRNKLVNAEYPENLIAAAHYCLCTAIDESVLRQKWGANSVWVQGSLLTIFHNESWGGERFYIILENMAKESRHNIEFLELAYFLLSLGFEGKYFGDNLTIREEIRNRTFYRIRNSREKPDKTLSRHWRDERPLSEERHKQSRLKRIGLFTGVALLAIVIYFNVQVHNAASPILQRLDNIATLSPVTVFSQVIQRAVVARRLE